MFLFLFFLKRIYPLKYGFQWYSTSSSGTWKWYPRGDTALISLLSTQRGTAHAEFVLAAVLLSDGGKIQEDHPVVVEKRGSFLAICKWISIYMLTYMHIYIIYIHIYVHVYIYIYVRVYIYIYSYMGQATEWGLSNSGKKWNDPVVGSNGECSWDLMGMTVMTWYV